MSEKRVSVRLSATGGRRERMRGQRMDLLRRIAGHL